MPTLHSYVMTMDDGFAPNPFHDVLTLACCMTTIRRVAEKDDYIVGLTGQRYRQGGPFRIIYAAKVTEEPLPFNKYGNSPEFAKKHPDLEAGGIWAKGDNAYRKLKDGEETAGLHVFFTSGRSGYKSLADTPRALRLTTLAVRTS